MTSIEEEHILSGIARITAGYVRGARDATASKKQKLQPLRILQSLRFSSKKIQNFKYKMCFWALLHILQKLVLAKYAICVENARGAVKSVI